MLMFTVTCSSGASQSGEGSQGGSNSNSAGECDFGSIAPNVYSFNGRFVTSTYEYISDEYAYTLNGQDYYYLLPYLANGLSPAPQCAGL